VTPAEPFTDVAAASDVPDGELLGVSLPDGTPVCLYNSGGMIGAVGGQCTHQAFAMSDGVLRPDGTIECVWHGARFDCRTGGVRRHPATESLPVFGVRIQDGRVLVGRRAVAAEERSA